MRRTRWAALLIVPLLTVAVLCAAIAARSSDSRSNELRPPAAFDQISNREARSAALFTEAAKVIDSPRCLNCHPAERRPTQGTDLHPHVPLIVAGESGNGEAGVTCRACHQDANRNTLGDKIQSVPGDPHWGLAPAQMAWQRQSIAEICQQVKDPARNGGRSLAQIHSHMATDHLVGWAWRPGRGRVPAPGTQQRFGELIQAWIDSGAACPS
jgi:hypothetical protein